MKTAIEPDREELRLPVLERVLPEVRPRDVGRPADLPGAVVGPLLVQRAPAGHGLSEPRAEEDRRHHEEERVREEPAPEAARVARPRGRARPRVAAELLPVLGLDPGSVERLRLGRAALQEPDGGEDEERELEVLGLPVLEHRLPEARRDEVAGVRDGLGAVECGVLVVGPMAGDRLRDQRAGEEGEEDERERVVAEPAHQRWASPTTVYRAMPAAITTTIEGEHDAHGLSPGARRRAAPRPARPSTCPRGP